MHKRRTRQRTITVKDSMILIHLATLSILRDACIMLNRVIIPPSVHIEVVERGIERGHPDALIVKELEEQRLIEIVAVTERQLMNELERFGLKSGELEAVALYFQERGDLLASNDDQVRRLRLILNLNLVSSPEIIFIMAKKKAISKKKAIDCLIELKKVGWFLPSIIDLIVEEVRGLD